MKTKKKSKKKGFTLIELLVVIAIIAILSVVVVLTLNPAEMLRRSRDSNRASDLSIIKTAISLYLADVSTTAMGATATPTCYEQFAGASAPLSVYEFTPGAAETGAVATDTLASATACPWFSTATTNPATTSASRAVNVATGWIPINLSLISSGAPIGQWPADPSYSPGTNAGTGNAAAGHFYSYTASTVNNAYKLAAKMESALYSSAGTSDLESTDGGTDNDMYEQGTNLSL